ncbi:glycerophosphoryl diester phosphodiesterase [Thermosinus carboxydivorans Nor1]|uniref:Glycerophosphoryl diester phosphodiesterase n=1 Tax=Thermosinus carboxydivorans Nor1 TaxID=401526 RepID=A1HRW3_9FIRM|nr:glycerophosphodiester phosphodiesterase [Thermosinus carboxydivorans]EAX47284.1 glycerophosphoryl diester phosphodiesterase [Thermosinus carboxydivorans Nor1]
MKTAVGFLSKLLVTVTVAVAVMLVSSINMPAAYAKVKLDMFDLEAHRGGRDVRPENTLISFAYALELGVTTLEMDMQMTKDGHIVISHNPKMSWILARGPNGQYVSRDNPPDIRLMTLAEIKQYDVGVMNPNGGDYYESHGRTQLAVPGTRIPTLEEVFELVNAYGNKTVLFNIETKSYADPADPGYINNPDPAVFVKKVYDIIKRYHMEDRVMLQSFDWRTLKEMQKLDPNITLVALTCEQPSWGRDGLYRQVGEIGSSPWMGGLDIDDFNGDYVKAAKAIGADVISPYFKELSLELVEEAHELGMKVVPWTVNREQDMNMLIDMGVDGIITDKPHVLRSLLIKRGIKVAEPTKAPPGMIYSTGTSVVSGVSKQLAKGGDAAH